MVKGDHYSCSPFVILFKKLVATFICSSVGSTYIVSGSSLPKCISSFPNLINERKASIGISAFQMTQCVLPVYFASSFFIRRFFQIQENHLRLSSPLFVDIPNNNPAM